MRGRVMNDREENIYNGFKILIILIGSIAIGYELGSGVGIAAFCFSVVMKLK